MTQTAAPVPDTIRVTWLSIVTALALICLGAFSALMPAAVGVTVGIFIVLVIVFGGVAHLVHAWDLRDSRLFHWRLAVGMLYLCGGVLMLSRSTYNLTELSRFIAVMFAIEALLLLAAGWLLRDLPGRRWMNLDGILTLSFAALILALTPWSSAWELGLIVGANVLFSGFAYLALLRSADLRLPDAGNIP